LEPKCLTSLVLSGGCVRFLAFSSQSGRGILILSKFTKEYKKKRGY